MAEILLQSALLFGASLLGIVLFGLYSLARRWL